MSDNKNGQKFNIKFSEICETIIFVIGLILISYVFLISLVFKCDAMNSKPFAAFFLPHLIIIALIFVGIFFLNRFSSSSKFYNKNKNVFIGLLFSLSVSVLFCTSYSYVTQVKFFPSSDQSAVYTLARMFYNSDFSAVVPKDSYLSLWPFQSGFIFYLEKLMRVFNDTSYMLPQKINVLFLCLLYSSGFWIIRLYTDKIGNFFLYSVLMCTYLPLIFRTFEIYGDLGSLALMMFAVLMYLLFVKVKKYYKIPFAILFVLSMFVAALFKSFALILCIAILIQGILNLIKNKQFASFVLILIALILAFSSTKITQKYYEHYANNEMGKGVPSISFIAMALQDTAGENGLPGGWNGYHSDLYMECDYDYELAKEISRESVSESIDNFVDHPLYAVSFFARKSLSWANQTYSIFWSTNLQWGEDRDENSFWVRFFTQEKYEKFLDFMDVHQSLIYAIILTSCIYLIFRKREMHDYIPILMFVGGFLFLLMWENQAGALYYYPMILLPFSLGWLDIPVQTKESEDMDKKI